MEETPPLGGPKLFWAFWVLGYLGLEALGV